MTNERLTQRLRPHGTDEAAAVAAVAALPEVALITEMIRRALRDEFACGARIGRGEVEDERRISGGRVASAHDMA